MKTLSQMSKKQLGYLEGAISIVINTILFGIKFWIGRSLHSVAMVSDSWHTFSDSLTSVLVVIGFYIAARPADKEHPFGHGRAESIASLIIGTLLTIVGLNFFTESINRLIHNQAMQFTWTAAVIFLVSVVVKEALAQFSFWAGRRTNSLSLTADGWHHRSDAIVSGLIVIGGIFNSRFWWIDGVLGLVVSLLILHAAIMIIKPNVHLFLGEKMDPVLEKKIRIAVKDHFPNVADMHHFHMHRYGEHIEVTFHARMNPDIPLNEAHRTTHEIAFCLKKEQSIEATVHLEPSRRQMPAELKKQQERS